MYDSIKVSALSLMPIKWDKFANADRLEDFFVRAARDAPRLIVGSEGAFEGYVIADAIDFPETAEAVRGIAEPLDGPYVTRFRKLARSLRTCLCFGMAERVGDDVYNCAVVIGDDGEICETYHKTQL